MAISEDSVLPTNEAVAAAATPATTVPELAKSNGSLTLSESICASSTKLNIT